MKKKQDLIASATQLFADQGFEATTTLEIARAARTTEPLIYYHFKSKDQLFAEILTKTYEEYFRRLDELPAETKSQFKKMENLIGMHLDFVEQMPSETYLIFSNCPAKLKDGANECAQMVQEQRKRLNRTISGCLKAGMKSGEFLKLPVAQTANLILGVLSGILRQRSLRLDRSRGIKKALVEFCRRGLTGK